MLTGKVVACRGFRQLGGIYIAVLVALSVISTIAASALTLGAAAARRDAEQQLLVIGAEFQQALRSYAALPPGAVLDPARGPRRLEDLLRDPRVPGIRRHLRQIYADPLTGRPEWGLVLDHSGAIIGVHSLATGRPIKRGGFDPQWESFEEAESYEQWVFGAIRARGVGAAVR